MSTRSPRDSTANDGSTCATCYCQNSTSKTSALTCSLNSPCANSSTSLSKHGGCLERKEKCPKENRPARCGNAWCIKIQGQIPFHIDNSRHAWWWCNPNSYSWYYCYFTIMWHYRDFGWLTEPVCKPDKDLLRVYSKGSYCGSYCREFWGSWMLIRGQVWLQSRCSRFCTSIPGGYAYNIEAPIIIWSTLECWRGTVTLHFCSFSTSSPSLCNGHWVFQGIYGWQQCYIHGWHWFRA